METGFKLLFLFGVFLYSVITVGVFLLILRILLIFYPELQFMGFTIT
jgi:hypothetical protein